MKKNYNFFLISREVQHLYNTDTTLIMLERTRHLAFRYCCQCSVDFKIPDLMVHIMQKYGQKIKVNRQHVSINAYVRISQSLLCRKIYELFETLIYLCRDFYFLCEYFFMHLSLIFLPLPGFQQKRLKLIQSNQGHDHWSC